MKLIKVLINKESKELVSKEEDLDKSQVRYKKIYGKKTWPEEVDITDKKSIRNYLAVNYGKGKYYVFKFGGYNPNYEQFFIGWIE